MRVLKKVAKSNTANNAFSITGFKANFAVVDGFRGQYSLTGS